MGTSKPSFGSVREAHEELKEDHREILATLDRLENAQDASEVAALLHALMPRLKEHFAKEEHSGGLYERVGAKREDFTDQIRELVDDHFRIMSAIQASRPTGPEHQELTLRFARELVGWLRDHERREYELARQAEVDE